MILVWNDVDSFKQHLEDMKNFRQHHNNLPTEQSEDIALSLGVTPPQAADLIKSITNDRGRTIFVPIWSMKSARRTNN